MEVLKVSNVSLKKAARIVKRGGVIVYPTDTAYALGGVFNSSKVINKVLRIKQRKDKKFTVVAGSIRQVKKYFKLTPAQEILAKRFWPGPLSIVLTPNISIRVPANYLARRLCQLSGRPLIATSANISGGQTPYRLREVLAEFENRKFQPNLILDGGTLKKRKTSTVVKVVKDKIVVLRPGAVDPFKASYNKNRGSCRQPE